MRQTFKTFFGFIDSLVTGTINTYWFLFRPPSVPFPSRFMNVLSDSTLTTLFLSELSFSAPFIDAFKLQPVATADLFVTHLCSPFSFIGFDGVRHPALGLGRAKEESGTKECSRVGFHMFSKLSDRFLIRSVVSIAKNIE